jgi:phage tail protein X
MGRYNSAKGIRDKNEKYKLATFIFPPMPISDSDIYIQTTSIDRLDKLANTFYENVDLWWVIAAANGLGKGTLVVPKDTKLRIPDKNIVQTTLKAINTTR